MLSHNFGSQALSGNKVAEIIRQLESMTTPYSLILRDNQITVDGLASIRRLLNLQLSSLDLAYNSIQLTKENENIFVDFCYLLGRSKVQSLDLSGNQLGDDGLNYLLPALLENKSLKSLTLVNTGITDKSIPSIQKLLVENNSLCTLNLAKNNITYQGYNEILDSLRNNISLTDLDISHNFHIQECKIEDTNNSSKNLDELSECKTRHKIRLNKDTVIYIPVSLLTCCLAFFSKKKANPTSFYSRCPSEVIERFHKMIGLAS